MKFEDLTTKKFGMLTCIERAENKGKKTVWLCRCDCGKETRVMAGNLKNCHTTSCGHIWKDAIAKSTTKHGLAKLPEYKNYSQMMQRCNNPNAKHYSYYGGRGIKVCKRWQGESGMRNFLKDMGNRTTPLHTLDRIDGDGDYEPSNCRWATRKEQSNNISCNLDRQYVDYKGKRITVLELAKAEGVSMKALYWRKQNWGSYVK